MAKNFTAALVQMNCMRGDKAANLAKADMMIDEACRSGAKLVILPELFSTGYRVEADDARLAEPIPGETVVHLEERARKHGIYIIGALIEKACDGQLYDTAVLIGAKEGYIGKHRKIHLWGGEPNRFARGTELNVFQTDLGTIGMLICYEIGFPEQARVLAQKGASLIVYTAAFGRERRYAWDVASRARALENGVFVLACNRIGTEDDTVLGGASRIVAPDTEVLAETGTDEEAVICAAIDPDDVEKNRRAIPYLRDLNDRLTIHNF